MTTAITDRAEILAEIQELETRLAVLRASLPTAIKSFFRFRCKPERSVWIYGLTRHEAEKKLHERMNASYPDGWSLASNAVDQFNDPGSAAANTPGSLLRALTTEDAKAFIADWREDAKSRAGDPDRPKNLPKSQVEQDIESYEYNMRRREAG